jgi:hypothetical protein
MSEEIKDRYKDPEDVELKNVIFKVISTIRGEDDVFEFLDEYASDWIVKKSPEYCEELLTLSNNWKLICDALKQTKKSILIVRKTVFTDPENQYIILRAISEILTRCGYCIRSVDEVNTCESCNLTVLNGKNFCFNCEKIN